MIARASLRAVQEKASQKSICSCFGGEREEILHQLRSADKSGGRILWKMRSIAGIDRATIVERRFE